MPQAQYGALNDRPFIPKERVPRLVSDLGLRPLPELRYDTNGLQLDRIEAKLDRIIERQEHKTASGIWIARNMSEALELARREAEENKTDASL